MSIQFNPNMYAQQYAIKNNLSLEDAKSELKSQYGDPSQDNTSIFPQSFDNFEQSFSMPEMNNNPSFRNEMESEQSGSFWNSIMNFFRPQEAQGTQGGNEMNFNGGQQAPQSPDGLMQPFGIQQPQGAQGGNEMNFNGGQHAPQAPNGQMNPFGAQQSQGVQNNQMDPDTYAQQYANENGLTLEEAKAELKEKYGDPQAQTASNTASNPFGSINFQDFNIGEDKNPFLYI